jgi:hypothetical protein
VAEADRGVRFLAGARYSARHTYGCRYLKSAPVKSISL